MHSYVCCYLHRVFATAGRERFLQTDVQQRLWPYLGGVARENGMTAMAVGGVEDHVHILLSLPSTVSISRALQLLKGNSSKWIHETFADRRRFAWQEGYGAFSIAVSGIEATRRYIARQSEHHRRKSFREEMEEFLKKHGMKWTERDAVEEGGRRRKSGVIKCVFRPFGTPPFDSKTQP